MQKLTDKKNMLSRRDLLGGAATVAAFTIVPRHVLAASGQPAPSDKINMGAVGVGGNLGGVDLTRTNAGQNVYALCDVDERLAGARFVQNPNAKLYKDYRRMFDKEAKNLQAITCTIPDFSHASVAMKAMERGIGCYIEKPLTQSIWEARLLKKAYQKYKVGTQMGNQGFSSEAARVSIEIIWSGQLGDVAEVHSMNSGGFARGIEAWPEPETVPATLNWDLWQGHTRDHTYSSRFHPANWRGVQEYGTGMIGDWGIHQLANANFAFGLYKTHATSVTCIAVEGANPITYPHYACVYEFPERDHPYIAGQKMPPLKVYWYEGNCARNITPPASMGGAAMSGYNCYYIGTKGIMGTAGHANSVNFVKAPDGFVKPKEMIARIPNGSHMEDFVRSVKEGKDGVPACSNFNVSAPYTEWMLLGAISWRFPNEKLLWDGPNMRFTNNEKANEYIKPFFRKDWELQDITV
jgi:predicted dehydrogenase